MYSEYIHSVFDILAWVMAGLTGFGYTKFFNLKNPVPSSLRGSYSITVFLSAGIGAYIFGTLNLIFSGQSGLARSIEGAMVGAVSAIEIYKFLNGIHVRTGARFAAPLATGVCVGRIGCYLSGIEDFTYGTPTQFFLGHDFGDGILRHPVQLYESASLFAFLTVYTVALVYKSQYVARNGLYLALGFYGFQRFIWEFLKPYEPVIGFFTVFHLLSLVLIIYAVIMLSTDRNELNGRFIPA